MAHESVPHQHSLWSLTESLRWVYTSVQKDNINTLTKKTYALTVCLALWISWNFLRIFSLFRLPSLFCCLNEHIFSANNVDREWDVEKERETLYLGRVWTVVVCFGQLQVQQIRDDPWKLIGSLTAGQGPWPPPRGGITEAYAAVRTKSSYTFINTHTAPISAMQLLVCL